MEIGGHLGHSSHKAIEFKISLDRRKNASTISTPGIIRADFGLIREVVSKVSWDNVFEGAQIHKCWSLFKHLLLQAQEQTSQYVRSPADKEEGWLG